MPGVEDVVSVPISVEDLPEVPVEPEFTLVVLVLVSCLVLSVPALDCAPVDEGSVPLCASSLQFASWIDCAHTGAVARMLNSKDD